MGKRKLCIPFLLAIIFLTFVSNSYSQEKELDIEELKKSAPKVFIDCERCDVDYIRTEITFVNYVWDRKEADVHILITDQGTGSGGREYTIAFIGQNECANLQNTLKYYSNRIETRDEVRKGLVRTLKLGLGPYVAGSPMAQRVSVQLDQKVKPTAVVDKWNFWVFSTSVRGRFSGEEQRSSTTFSGNLSANRVTPASKLRLGLNGHYDRDEYEHDDGTTSSISESGNFDGLYVISISEHWSVGAWVSASTSTYRNIDFAYTFHPAIEYNFFPYSQSTRRQLRCLYRIGYGHYSYREETIYDKTSEGLLNQILQITLELNEPWGTAEFSLRGSNYFHDFNKNNFRVSGELNFRIWKGLSLDFDASYSATRDQLSLPKGEATLEEILLRRRELASGYRFNTSIGLSFRFGSVFSNVVNPRFGDGHRGGGRGRR